ncbi:hypothetical protein GCM10022408_32680 [Hymenobacter fastidiosus]|uniref:Uncharacterized protein n=1 Tax=Hymenobacter fastidiosus TaxID=486264 RepID=A0ABP7SUA2_9BACT
MNMGAYLIGPFSYSGFLIGVRSGPAAEKAAGPEPMTGTPIPKPLYLLTAGTPPPPA